MLLTAAAPSAAIADTLWLLVLSMNVVAHSNP